MKWKKSLLTPTIVGALLLPTQVSAAVTPSITTEEAIQRYHETYDAYTKDELVKVEQYRNTYENIKGSLADRVVERAIWYMDNGYTVYGGGWNSYPSDGVVDCSEFTKLVYGDFGFDLTDVASRYDTVGTKVSGVYPQKIDGKWSLAGTENLRPGDILTWWKTRSDGTRYIGHVAIYMGLIDGKPAVIGTSGSSNPTAIGIIDSFQYWWGEHFFSAQRVLPSNAWTPGKVIEGHEEQPPVIPDHYVLPPQKPVVSPSAESEPSTTTDTSNTANDTVQKKSVVSDAWGVGYYSEPSTNSQRLGALSLNESLPFIKKYNSYWYIVDVNGKQAYITANSSLTHVEGNTQTEASQPETSTSAQGEDTTTTTSSDYVVAEAWGGVGYFEKPSTRSTRMGELLHGESALLIEQYNSYWYKIEIDGKIAYITANSSLTSVENK